MLLFFRKRNRLWRQNNGFTDFKRVAWLFGHFIGDPFGALRADGGLPLQP